MEEIINKLEPAEWLKLNASLQKKKSALRKELASLGVLKKDKNNAFDKYSYFSEAGYKELFTKLFSNHGLEITANELDYASYETNSEKMPNGRRVTFEFILTDIDTGFFEKSVISGEGMDKGDKGGYKADTGALKYYLANTFMVATGDDPETESPEAKGAPKPNASNGKITNKQMSVIREVYRGEDILKLLASNNITKLEDMPQAKASEIVGKIFELKKKNEQAKENKQ